ncbi:PAS domain S-box protein [Endothiovibrio diazotrophicus]
MHSPLRERFVDRRAWLLPVALWTTLIGFSLQRNLSTLEEQATDLAVNRGRFIFQMIEATRLWNARHGGLYAVADDATPSDPYLGGDPGVPERDVVTSTGTRLTLINPAYMTRQLAAVVEEQSAVRVHLTSLDPINPGNAPDPWERAALKRFEGGLTEEAEFRGSGPEARFRYIAPLMAKQACLRCHAVQGYRIGEVRGGISVSFPARPLLAGVAAQRRNMAAIHGVVWLLLSGLTLLALWRIRARVLALHQARADQERLVEQRTAELRQEAEERREAEAQMRQVIDSSSEGIFVVDRSGICTLCNPTAARLLGFERVERLLGRRICELIHPEHAATPEEQRCPLVVSYRDGRPAHDDDHCFTRADGSPLAVEYRADPVELGGKRIGAVVTFSDISARKETEERLRKLSMAVEYSPASVVITNAEGSIEYVNRRFSEVTGYRAEEVLGENPRILKSGETPAGVYDELWSTITAGRVWHGEFIDKKKDGGFYWEAADIAPLHDRYGAITHFVAVKEDVTERKQVEAELQRAKLEADQANQAKSEFLANMSHEIRTPMNAIIGMAELLAETDLNAEQRQYVKVFGNAGNSLLGLIDDILDLSKIEAGQLELEAIPFDLRALVEDVVEMLSFRAKERGLRLAGSVHPALPAWWRGDPKRLRQILVNLTGNAIKFTHQGEVTLRVEPREAGLRFAVHDTGIGIAAERQGAIFQAFTQEDASVTRRYGGSGLGLTICQRLAGMMEGEIGLESEMGRGSTFHFNVPLEAAEPPEATPDATAELAGMQVLVVDDYAVNRFILNEMLTALGAEVTLRDGFENGLREVENAPAGAFDLVLLDCRMPGADGFSMAHAVRRLTQPRPPPMVMLSSDVRHCDAEHARHLGLPLVQKPFRRSELLRAISAALGGAAHSGKRREATATPPARGRGLTILAAEDNPDNALLLRAYLKRTPHHLELVENGERAVAAVQARRFDLILMDMQMPVMDGYSATRAIRAWEREQGRTPIPILALTAHALGEDHRRSLDAGCDEHLNKPLKKPQLLTAIERFGGGGGYRHMG